MESAASHKNERFHIFRYGSGVAVVAPRDLPSVFKSTSVSNCHAFSRFQEDGARFVELIDVLDGCYQTDAAPRFE